MKYSVLGVSAGNGVLLHPFKDQNLLGNIEHRNDYYINGLTPQWDLNFKGLPMGRVIKLTETPDVILGHPKCGHSSMLALSRGKAFTSHKGEPSLDLFVNSIKKYYPKLFLLENLPKLKNSFNPSEAFSEAYSIIEIQESVDIFGNSQVNRNRLFIIGYRGSKTLLYDAVGQLLESSPKPKSTGELLRNLPDNGHFREPLSERIAIYGGRKMTFKEIKQYWIENPQKKRFDTDNHLGSAPGVYRNLSDHYPATVRKGNREFNPKGHPMSPRERARIQGIPDGFIIADPETHPNISFKTLLNKGRVSVANTPPYEVGLWFKSLCEKLL